MLTPLVIGALLLAAPAPRPVYDFQWRADAQLSRLDGGQIRVTRDAVEGHGRLVLSSLEGDVLAFEWTGEGGNGRGIVGPGGVEEVSFPMPQTIGYPPSPPHRLGGVFRFEGPREQPTRFEVTYGEAFVCRTEPSACDEITTWERRFAGQGTRLTRETRAGSGARMAGLALQALIGLSGGVAWRCVRRTTPRAPSDARRA